MKLLNGKMAVRLLGKNAILNIEIPSFTEGLAGAYPPERHQLTATKSQVIKLADMFGRLARRFGKSVQPTASLERRVARAIQNRVSFFNGWRVSAETETEACLEAARAAIRIAKREMDQ